MGPEGPTSESPAGPLSPGEPWSPGEPGIDTVKHTINTADNDSTGFHPYVGILTLEQSLRSQKTPLNTHSHVRISGSKKRVKMGQKDPNGRFWCHLDL